MAGILNLSEAAALAIHAMVLLAANPGRLHTTWQLAGALSGEKTAGRVDQLPPQTDYSPMLKKKEFIVFFRNRDKFYSNNRCKGCEKSRCPAFAGTCSLII